jgi:bisphosphoglycerate-independent phosphoglycerate mutase (AlkP superfamily)
VAREHLGIDLPLVAAREAGARLARLAAAHDLVLYETFLPDLAGHRRIDPAWVLSRLDDLLGGVLDHLPGGVTLVLTSDHGNVEDTTTKAHTVNPVPLLVIGPGAGHFEAATALTDVAPGILAVLGAEVGG